MLTQLLTQLVEIPSAASEEYAIINFLSKYLQRLNFEVEAIPVGPERMNLVAKFGASASKVGFYAHVDTENSQFDFAGNPFSLDVSGGFAQGAGVCEMKAGIAAILETCMYASSHNIPMSVFFSVGSTSKLDGVRELVTSNAFRDLKFLIVPRAVYEVTNDGPFGCCLGRCGAKTYQLQIDGRMVHAVIHEKGRNAVVITARLLEDLSSQRFRFDSKLGDDAIIVDHVESQGSSFSIPSVAHLTLILRSVSKESSNEFESWLKGYAAQNEFSITLSSSTDTLGELMPFTVDKNEIFVQHLIENAVAPFGVTPHYSLRSSDENVLAEALAIPVVTMGPHGRESNSIRESVDLHSLQVLCEAFQSVVHLGQSKVESIVEPQVANF